MSAPTWRSGRRGWITAGSLSAVLVAGLTTQLVPTASAQTPRVRAAAVAAPTVVEPSPDATDGPVAPVTVAPPAGTSTDAPAVAAPAPTTRTVTPARRPFRKPARPVARPVAKPAPVAQPAGSDVCSGPGWQQRRGSRALASLRHSTPAGVSVSFQGSRSGYLGLTYPAQHHVDMFVRSCSAESAALLRHVMAHEMGHAYDAAHMTASSRAAYMAARGIPAGTPWFGCAYCTDFATPAGDFAETYSQWQRGTSDSRSQLAPAASPAALARLGALFFSA